MIRLVHTVRNEVYKMHLCPVTRLSVSFIFCMHFATDVCMISRLADLLRPVSPVCGQPRPATWPSLSVCGSLETTGCLQLLAASSTACCLLLLPSGCLQLLAASPAICM
ncbi:hypothetical protein O6H91_19G041500 [Diphasiastrum complanatum]|uniref:Uncharacterized protein n=1 Tax=Diphasiastrum complanatum TaxID=34168 RepID=A0ACC2AV91_DIPCM|nr:hypothetical protein O6H91_19G041500 [Diphasiastrum complanatum]